ncbi:MAG: carboxypeptidase-like regulatory domain-containing protein, partial [Chloroflexi bacterium]|nr:carboxypeptidase-like regulatory domain-containing protein [Chloroflexota bacterium]
MTKIAQRLAALALYGLLLTTALTGCSARGITGSITDNSTGLALTGVRVTVGDLQATTDDKGSYKLTLPLGTHHVQARLAGYRTFETDVTLDNKTRQVKLDISLQQRQLAGIVREEQQGALLGGVTVQIGDSSATTDDQGAFTLPVLPDNAITITKSGYYSATLDAAAVAALFDENGALISAYEATLKPRVVTGRLSEEGNGSPIAGTSIQIGEQKTTTDSSGAFTLSQVEPGQAITISAAAYRIPDGLTYNGEAELNLALKPYQAAVSISDAESGEALPEATLAAEAGDLSLQPDGRYLARVVPGTIMTASLVGYKNSTLTYNGEEELAVKLTPAQLVGQLTAADTGEPISGAVVLAYTQLPEPVVLRSDESGRFYYPEDNTVNEILVKVPGYERVSLPITRTGMLRLSLAPFEAKALYIPFGLLYDRAALEAVLDLAEGTEMNAIVVDMKDDWATVAWDSQVPLAIEVGAYNKDVMDAKDVIALAHERGLYVIGRMVVFKDDHLARAHPEYAVQRYSGGYYTDLEGLMWVDPFRPEVQQYNIDLAVELANLGIDEVQYDYIRFPSDGSVTGLLYSQEANYESRTRV